MTMIQKIGIATTRKGRDHRARRFEGVLPPRPVLTHPEGG